MTAPIRVPSMEDANTQAGGYTAQQNNPMSPTYVPPTQRRDRRTIQSVSGPGIVTTQAPRQATPLQAAPVGITPPAPQTSPQTGSNGAVGLTPTTGGNTLTNQTITPGELADRFAIAQQKFDQFAQSTGPAYEAALRQANRMGAAQGRLGSGSLRTDFGNLANQRNQQMDLARGGFLTDALNGSIEDAWRAIGLAERQQTFQNEQQEQAWRRALDRFGLGMSSNPAEAQRQWAEFLRSAGFAPTGG